MTIEEIEEYVNEIFIEPNNNILGEKEKGDWLDEQINLSSLYIIPSIILG